MKAVIIYFSGTGNTWYIAERISSVLEKKGAKTSVFSIEDIVLGSEKDILEDADHLLIGYPIYGSKAPKVMEEFINRLPEFKNKNVSVFTTVALYSGDGPIAYRKVFENKGYKFKSSMEFIMNNNFNVPGFPDELRVGTDEKIKKRVDKANNRVNVFADIILSNDTKVQGNNVFGKLLGRLQRKYVDTYIKKINTTMYVDDHRCIGCQKCIKYCPVNNYKISNNKIELSDKCIGCMRCYHICPTEAINITKKSLDGEKWPRFRWQQKAFEKTLIKKKSNV